MRRLSDAIAPLGWLVVIGCAAAAAFLLISDVRGLYGWDCGGSAFGWLFGGAHIGDAEAMSPDYVSSMNAACHATADRHAEIAGVLLGGAGLITSCLLVTRKRKVTGH